MSQIVGIGAPGDVQIAGNTLRSRSDCISLDQRLRQMSLDLCAHIARVDPAIDVNPDLPDI